MVETGILLGSVLGLLVLMVVTVETAIKIRKLPQVKPSTEDGWIIEEWETREKVEDWLTNPDEW